MGQYQREFKIDKLSDSNYHVWRFKMLAMLEATELAELVGDGAAQLLQEGEHQAENIKKDKKTRAMINLNIADHLIPVVRDKATAKLAWDAIAARFQTAGLAQKLYLRRQFFAAKMAEGTLVMKHVDE